MRTLLIGMVVGWMLARRYYFPATTTDREEPGRRAELSGDRAGKVAEETREVARDLGREAGMATRMGRTSLEDKARRIKGAAAD